MPISKKYLILIPLLLVLIFGFFAGKYYAWEQDHPERTSKSTFKDWQVAGILALIVIISAAMRAKDIKE